MNEKLRIFAEEHGRGTPYFIMEWNGFQVWDATVTRAGLSDEEDEMPGDAMFEGADTQEERPFLFVRGEEIRLSRPDETDAIVGLLPPEECSCGDYEEADFADLDFGSAGQGNAAPAQGGFAEDDFDPDPDD